MLFLKLERINLLYIFKVRLIFWACISEALTVTLIMKQVVNILKLCMGAPQGGSKRAIAPSGNF